MRYSKSTLKALAITGLFFIASCDVVNIDPQQSLSDEQIFTDPSAAQAAVIGMYDGLQEGGAFGGIGIMAADFSADVSRFTGSFTTFQQIRDYESLESTNGTILGIWADSYDPINRANNVFAGAPDVPDVSDAQRSQWQAEALFVRALCHFHLVRYFAQPYVNDPNNDGIPLVLEPTRGPGEHLNLERSSVEDVYKQIIEDLTTALDGLPAAQQFDGQATVGAAHALLARVYLHQQEWQLAHDHADEVIANSPFQLSADPLTPWADANYNGPEFIFAIQNRVDDQIGVNDALASFHRPDSQGGRGDIRAFSKLLDSYEATDLRRTGLFFETTDPDEAGVVFSGKWTHPNQADNVPVLRMADVYLMRAEAAAELGLEAPALADLNAVRARAQASQYDNNDYNNTAELVDLILLERYLELSFEGHRRHDFLRRGEGIQDENRQRVVAFGSDRTIFPIPARERDVNPNLSQNPGYN